MQSPPKWIYKLLERFCEPYLWEGISGDLHESFLEDVEEKGKWKAIALYHWHAIGFLRMSFKKKEKRISNMRSIWHNYLLTAIRSLRKQRALFAINLLGLVLAISCSLYALVFINDELHFDNQHSDGDRIYRLYKRYVNVAEGTDHLTYETSGMMGPTMTEEYAGVEDYIRICPWWHKVILSYEETNIKTEQIYFADSTFFDFFDFKVVQGDKATMLAAPSTMAISESLAKKLFGEKDPIGKVIKGLVGADYTITGIFEDPPRQSSFSVNALMSWSTTVPNVGPLGWRWMNNWLAQGIFTFVKLAPGTDPQTVVDKLPDMMNRHFEERADQYFLKLQPLNEMYLHGDNIRRGRGMRQGSITFVYTLGLSAFLIFLIASVNYINITLSRATQTQTEVGIRKVMGSTKRQLMGRFIAETFLSTTFASVVAVLLVSAALPAANDLTGKAIPTAALLQPITVLGIFGFIVGVSLLVGLYPAVVLSSPPISSILKASSGVVGTAGWFRKALMTLQYGISIFLIICTIIIIKQTSYLENKLLGFDKEQVLVIDIDNEIQDKAEVFENDLLQHPNILNTSISRSTIGGGSYSTTVFPEGSSDDIDTRIFGVDPEFFETFGIQTLAGRTFLKGSIADSNNLIINQAMVDYMGWENPVGKHIRFAEDRPPLQIIGVVNDFHVHSPATNAIIPMILHLDTDTKWYISARVGTGDLKETLVYINDLWDRYATRTPLDLFFVDEWFNQQYQKERQLLKISTMYSLISLLLCCLGLYGLTALILQQRTKEISIRKVLGAPLTSILSMMNRQFILIILIGFVLAAPLSYYLISSWLEKFAYRTSFDLIPFVIAGVLTLGMSLFIVSLLSARTAATNPSQNLKSE